MLKDLILELSDNQAITSSSSASTNTIDLCVEKVNLGANVHGAGYLNVVCRTDATPCLTAATGTATFSAQPTANDTLTIAGTAATFVASNPTSSQIAIGEDLAETLANIVAHSFGDTVKLSITDDDEITVTAVTAGTAGNAITLAKSSSSITLSGATLSGGVASNTITIKLQDSADNSSFSDVISATITDAKKGNGVCLRIPNVKRYIRTTITGSANLTGGKWDAWVGLPLTDH